MTAPRACVIGWPIKHSRSPLIHGYWLKLYGIEGAYEKREVTPAELPTFLENLPQGPYVGCNVTLPHKEAAFAAVCVTDEVTRRLGVVNTVFIRDGIVSGISTDGEGFIQNLLSNSPGFAVKGRHFTILGAGGSARAIVGTLAAMGAGRINVVNRTPERSEILRRDFGTTVMVVDWARREDILGETDVLVNTTSLGMTGQPQLEIALDRLPAHAIVTDIVYIPLETELIRRARMRGYHVVPGLGMLLYQAVPGFELWFGRRPEVTPELYDLVAADIRQSA
jgi:shikimate dehydrogenase